jgi:hypothetical protein
MSVFRSRLYHIHTSNAPSDKGVTMDTLGYQIPASQSICTKPGKPRPHICKICNRSFARLEHVKRHERSHTKEKPFGCHACIKCFSRKDQLIRHQQKLHTTNATSLQPPADTKESMPSTTGTSNRVCKSSVPNGSRDISSFGRAVNHARLRSNTISRIESSSRGCNDMTKADANGELHTMDARGQRLGHDYTDSMIDLQSGVGVDHSGMPTSTNQYGRLVGLHQTDMQAVNNMNRDNPSGTSPVTDISRDADFDQLFDPVAISNPTRSHLEQDTWNVSDNIMLSHPSASAGATANFGGNDGTVWAREWDMNMLTNAYSIFDDDMEVLLEQDSPWCWGALIYQHQKSPSRLHGPLLSQHASPAFPLETGALDLDLHNTTMPLAAVSMRHATRCTPGADLQIGGVLAQRTWSRHPSPIHFRVPQKEEDTGHDAHLRLFPRSISAVGPKFARG